MSAQGQKKARASRLFDQDGETIVETLAALVIVVLAFLALVNSVLAASKLTSEGTKRDQAIHAQQQCADNHLADGTKNKKQQDGTVTFSDGSQHFSVDVTFYGGSSIVSYVSKSADTAGASGLSHALDQHSRDTTDSLNLANQLSSSPSSSLEGGVAG